MTDCFKPSQCKHIVSFFLTEAGFPTQLIRLKGILTLPEKDKKEETGGSTHCCVYTKPDEGDETGERTDAVVTLSVRAEPQLPPHGAVHSSAILCIQKWSD